MQKQRSPSIIGLILTVGVVITALVYILIALNTQDALWFVTRFNEYPYEIAVYCYGEEIVLIPEDPVYDGLVEVVNETLSGSKNWDSLTMSEDTYQDYQTNQDTFVIELFYSPPVRIHSFYRFFSNLDSIIIPLEGRHANTFAIFGRMNQFSSAGALHYAGIPDIRSYVETQGICP